MAEEEVQKEEKKEKLAKKGFNIKVILIGLPLFIVQLILVYFITATFLVKNPEVKAETENVENSSEEGNAEGEEAQKAAHIYSIEDLIINPAGTNGQRLLLLSVGFGVPTEEKATILKDNEVVVKDLILNTISQKTLRSLSSTEQKDSLKVELASKINKLLPSADIENVYFSKYVLN